MLAKKLGDIRFLAIFGFCTILYVVGVVVGYSLDPSNNDIDYNLTQITWFKWQGAGTTFSLFLFGYTCQQNVLDAYKELESSNIRRMKKVATRQFLIVTAIYIFIGLFGYFNFPTPDPDGKQLLQMYDPAKQIPALIAIILLSVAIVVPLPLIFKPAKDCIAILIYPKDPEHNCVHYPLSIALAALNMVICSAAVIYKVGMNKMLTYVSGVTSPFMCLLFPYMFFTHIFARSKSPYGKARIIAYYILEVFCILLWIFTVLQFIFPSLAGD
jgi:amino acid permease